MSRRNFLIFAAIVYAIFGLGLLIVPAPFMAPFGVILDAYGEVTTRVLGAALLGIALLLWWVREAGDAVVLRAILRSQCIYNIIDIPVLVFAIAGGMMSISGLLPLALHAVLVAGFGYYGFGRAARIA